MKLTTQRLMEIIKEEYQSILNERTVRMGGMDLVFQGRDQVQILSRKGRTALSKMDAKMIINAVRKYIGGI